MPYRPFRGGAHGLNSARWQAITAAAGRGATLVPSEEGRGTRWYAARVPRRTRRGHRARRRTILSWTPEAQKEVEVLSR